MSDTHFQHRTSRVSAMVSKIETKCHPGLMLDKLLSEVPKEMKNARGLLDSVVKTQGDAKALAALNTRRSRTLNGLGAKTWEQKLISPMALHLARAALLENANVCLHRTYGFAYLPSSGLKGMARAWAITVWLADQQDKVAAWKSILRVFGFGNTPEYQTLLKQYPVLKIENRTECSGAVMFHDGWPKTWPKLEVDILTSHHSEYYSKNGARHPGDWEAPVPVNFLVVAKGTDFQFALSEVQGLGNSNDVELAREFLSGALSRRGAGGKTSSGYGYFAALEGTTPALNAQEKAATFECELELVTPAFLAGAEQYSAEGCDLRGATLRGQLRWWWRTLHAGYLEPKMLHQLESAIWGSASMGGAVSFFVNAVASNTPAVQYNRTELVNERDSKDSKLRFRKRSHSTKHARTVNIQKVTSGLQYISYGMQEKEAARFLRLPGCKWGVQFHAKQAVINVLDRDKKKILEQAIIPTSQVLKEVQAALWLLCQYGGVGSKARKGFGSLSLGSALRELNGEECKKSAAVTREQVAKLSSFKGAKRVTMPTPSLEQLITFKSDLQFNTTSRLQVIEQIGFSVSLFAADKARDLGKKALGLPRNVETPTTGEFRPQKPVSDRHSSPWHLSIHSHAKGLEVRYAAFPSPWLPDESTSKQWLEMLRNHLETDLKLRAETLKAQSKDFNYLSGVVPVGVPQKTVAGVQLPKVGDRIPGVLLEEKTKKGGWKVQVNQSIELIGNIQNSDKVPSDSKVGDEVMLIVKVSKANEMQYAWPTEADKPKEKSLQKPNNKPPQKGKW